MRFVHGRPAIAAPAVVLLATVLGCSAEQPSVTTKITFDGRSYEFDSAVSCVRQFDGGLVIDAPGTSGKPGGTLVPGRGKKLIRVQLLEEPRIVVETAALRFDEIRGFTDDSDEMWGTKVDDVYTINGRMPDDQGVGWHQFKIEVVCPRITTPPVVPPNPRAR